jgi:hypothetical protein
MQHFQDFEDYVLILQTQYHTDQDGAVYNLDPAAIRASERRRLTMLYFSHLSGYQQGITLSEALEGDYGNVLCAMLTTLVLDPKTSPHASDLTQRDVCIVDGIYAALEDQIADSIERIMDAKLAEVRSAPYFSNNNNLQDLTNKFSAWAECFSMPWGE